MDHRFSWILIAVVVCLASCSSSNGGLTDKTLAYRDLKRYFQDELHLMSGNKPALQKTIIMNGKRDSLTITSPDSAQLQHLLAPFLEVDLNKPSLRGAYDTIMLADQFSGRHSLMYKARNTATVPQEVIMDIDSLQHITNVQMNKHVENLVYEYQQNLVYQQNKHIRIVTWQKIAFLPATELDVKVLLKHP